MKRTFAYNTKIGKITIIEEDNKIINILFGEITDKILKKETPLIKKTIDEIIEYLEGKRFKFDIHIGLKGTDFQKKVWKELLKIPYGKTCYYEEIAKKIGNAKASRAVGMANHKNPIPIIVPCHRVIGKNGKLVGYAGGTDIKEKLLRIENNENIE